MIETKFKHTDIGLVPEDWTLLSIKEDVSVHARIGWQGLTTNEYLDHGLYRLVTSTDIENGGVNWDTCHYVSEWRYRQDDKIILEEGDTLLSKDGTIGKVAFVKNIPSPSTLNSGVYVLRPKDENKLTKGYLALCFKSMFFKDFMERLSAGSTINHLYQKDIIGFTFPVPNKEEQQRIASALMKVDALISNLDKLIAKKQAIKKGAMQELLTGKKRLPGFNEKWELKKLGNIGFTYSGLSGKSKQDFEKGNKQYITFLNVLNNPVLLPSMFEKVYIGPNEHQNKAIKGDLFFNTSSETPEEVGYCSMLGQNCNDLYLNSFCFGYRLDDIEVSPLYLCYYFRSKYGREIMTVAAQGVTRYNISKTGFSEIEIKMPPTRKEQDSIVNVLSTMDSDISLLQKKREKYQQIKQGMMRDLLTGRIRLLDNGDMGKKLEGTRYGSYAVGLHKDPFDGAIAAEPHPD